MERLGYWKLYTCWMPKTLTDRWLQEKSSGCSSSIPHILWRSRWQLSGLQWQEMKYGYLIIHLRISNNQCKDAKIQIITNQQIKSWRPSSGTERGHFHWFSASSRYHKYSCLLWDPGSTVLGAIQKNQQEMLTWGISVLHGNSCPYIAHITQDVLVNPLYSSDLAPTTLIYEVGTVELTVLELGKSNSAMWSKKVRNVSV